MKMGMRLAVATLAASGLIAAGCGGDDTEESGADSPDAAVTSFFAAIEDGDGDRACELMTDDSVEALELGGEECSTFAESEGSGDLPDDFEVGDATEDGDSATVNVTGDGEELEVPLVKDGDEWKVDFIGLGLAQAGASEGGDASAPDISIEEPTP
jgi:hypothetical protein